jgi:hypothetical protein
VAWDKTFLKGISAFIELLAFSAGVLLLLQ